MDLITGGAPLPANMRGGVVALGNFDGFHAGHQAVVGAALAAARAAGVPTLVASFDPHPARLFQPGLPPFRLTDPAQWQALLGAFGVDAAVLIPFDGALASLSAEAFVQEWLVGRLGVSGVVTGADFTFGRAREGDVTHLAALGATHGFTAKVVGAVTDSGGTISSTRIRAALRAADPAAAAALLTRRFAVRAEVIHGAKLGRQLGFPTANMALGDYVRPAYGVYAVWVRLPSGERIGGVANLGVRPMIEPPVELLETWLLDWDGDLYGQTLEVELVAYLRPEMKLDGLDALIAQVMRDAEDARTVLKLSVEP
ncbi:riboflavin biosynthesis protein [Polymorphobacter multimanifer]|uniref:Riboflavin biosynthesis protein n=1 Tax=Polymorphobacter multimanifer TaxID=1070431 RepID=A0A841LB94_9SPHN|nr:bifunctional riboflavin kinase/FAD synthetase [Polymorphobacter multimanifer]MBB6228243.1 riboflavin kinase/FMN adenylyltransferase [Polymorphobacter multimanifer]GGI85880.1 riboflavin biosynthesis protein [Polymorphobacter multimanifer]